MSKRELSDAMLMSLSSSSPEAFSHIYDRHSGLIASYFAKRVNPAEVGDLLSDVFLTAFKRRQQFDPSASSALPWLYGVAHHRLLHHFRSSARAGRAYQRYESQADLRLSVQSSVLEDGVVDDVFHQAQLREVREFIDQQSVLDREVLLLHVWEELTYQELSEVFDIPIGTVKSRLNRIRNKIREHFAPVGKVDSRATTRQRSADLQGKSEL